MLVARGQTTFFVLICGGGKIKTEKSGLATQDYRMQGNFDVEKI